MIYITQRSNRHIIKLLDTTVLPAEYVDSFGQFKVKGSGQKLASPCGITSDLDNNIYVCDFENQRVIKFDSSLTYLLEYSTRSSIGSPCAIMYDSLTGDLYVTGIYNYSYIRLQRLTVNLDSVKFSSNLNSIGDVSARPTGLCRGFDTNSFIVSGFSQWLYQTIETANFSNFELKVIFGEVNKYPKLFTTTLYNSIIKHSNNFLYLNNGKKILKVNELFENIGDSKIISKTIFGLKECPNTTILTYINDDQKLIRLNQNMNFIEDIYYTTGNTIDFDAFDINDFIQI